MCRWALCLLTMLLLGACTDLGPRYGDTASRPVPANEARVVFYRLPQHDAGGVPLRIGIDGRKIGWVANGALLIVDRPPGEILFTARGIAHYDDVGGLEHRMMLAAGRTYYVELGIEPGCGQSESYIEPDRCLPLSSLPAAAQHYWDHCGTAWCFAIRNETAALPRLAALRIETLPSDTGAVELPPVSR